jgi:RNA polymerase sigma-70 factor (ECF subfamily)
MSDETLRGAWTRAQQRWPDVEVPFEVYQHHVHALPDAARDDVLAKLHLEDLLLACACLRRDPAALRRFDHDVLVATEAALRGLDAADSFVDEVQQRLRTKLLAGDGSQAPRIAEYAGRGALVAWVTVAAVRTGLTLLRERKRAEKYAGDGWAEALALPDTGDLEVDYIKQRYREDFTRGLVEACNQLPARDRTILRLHFVDGLNIDQIGVIYGVHRATIARWIAKSRTALLTSTRDWLTAHLAVPSSEFSSLDRLVRSQLDVSLGALFPEDEAALDDDPSTGEPQTR